MQLHYLLGMQFPFKFPKLKSLTISPFHGHWSFLLTLSLRLVIRGCERPWASQCRRDNRLGFDPWVGKMPWRKAWQPTPIFLPAESPRTEELEDYSPWGHKELETTEQLSTQCLSMPLNSYRFLIIGLFLLRRYAIDWFKNWICQVILSLNLESG